MKRILATGILFVLAAGVAPMAYANLNIGGTDNATWPGNGHLNATATYTSAATDPTSVNTSDIQIGSGAGGTGSLTVQSGTLNITNTLWSAIIGQSGGNGTLTANGGTLNWQAQASGNAQFNIGNASGSTGTVNVAGGALNIDSVALYVGSDPSSVGRVNVTGGVLTCNAATVGFGSGGSVNASTTGVLTFGLGSGIVNFPGLSSLTFGTLGAANYINFVSGSGGQLEITNWSRSQFDALVVAGSVRIDGAAASTNRFDYKSSGGIGIYQLTTNFINIGRAELLYTDSQMPFTMDASFATLKRDSNTISFFESDRGVSINPLRYHGPLDAPLQTHDANAVMDFSGFNTGNTGGASGLWIPNIYDDGSGTLIGLTHREDYAGGGGFFAIGLSKSTNGGADWKYLGDILRPYVNNAPSPNFGYSNIGGVPYLIVGNYLYIYFNEHTGITAAGTKKLAVARALVSDVMAAVSNNTVPLFYKFANGAWTENGLTGNGDNIIPGGEILQSNQGSSLDFHSDAAYCAPLGKYLITVQTHSQGKLLLFTSTNGLSWGEETLLDYTPGVMQPYSFFASLNADASSDCRVVGKEFYIYYPCKDYNNYGVDTLYRRQITIGSVQNTNLVWDPNGNGSDGAGTWNVSNLVWTNPASGGADIAWRNSANDLAVFGAGSGAAGTVTVSGTLTAGGLTFNAPGSGNYTLSGGTLTLSGTPVIAANIDATMSSVLAGAAFTKTGAGTLTLSATNTFTGYLVNVAGGLTISGAGQLGGGTYVNSIENNGTFTFASSASQTLSGVIIGAGAVKVNGPGTLTLSAQQELITGPVAVNGGKLVLANANSGNVGLYGCSGLTIAGGTVQVNNDNALSGYAGNAGNYVPVTIQSGGVLTGSGTSVNLRSVLTLAGGVLASSGTVRTDYGSWDLCNGVAAGGVAGTSAISASAVIPNQSGGTIFNVSSGASNGIDLDVTGTLINGTSAHDTGVIKTGNGVMRLGGASTYIGPTTVSSGKLIISTVFAGKGDFSVTNGATLGVTNFATGSALVSNLTVYAGAALEFQKVTNLAVPLITASNLTISGSCVVKVTGTNGLTVGSTYPLVGYAGTLSGFANLQLQLPAGISGTLISNANQIALSVTGSGVPAAPAGLAATAGNAQVALSWSAVSGATNYNVKRSTVNGGSYTTITNVTTASYTDAGLVNGSTYYYVVSAVNAAGESANSTQASAMPLLVPAAPVTLTAAATNTQVTLNWSASALATGYNVKRSTTSGSGYALVGSAAGTTFTDTGLALNQTYYYVVTATNNLGESAASPEASATPQLVATSVADLTVWYNSPGTVNLKHGLMLGNGRLGGIVLGNVTNESIVLNEISLWSGNTNSSGGFATGPTGAFGSYQLFGNLLLKLPAQTGYTGYKRALNLNTGEAAVTYTNGGVAYTRTLFCSNPDQVLVARLTASAAGAYTGSIQLSDGHSTTPVSTAGGLMFSGALANGELYEAQLQVTNSGGTLVNSGGVINFTNCDSLTLVVALGTSYSTNYLNNFVGANPHAAVVAQAQAAVTKSFATLESAHTNDFSALFNRVSLDLGPVPAGRANLPTDQRITANVAAGDDPGMDVLMFAYGRYVMIASSRNSLPMNLQGLWNDSNNPNWASDYHSDLNVEIMYSSEQVANLPECFLPFVNYLQSQIPVWRYFTTNTSSSINTSYGGGFGGTNGWATRTSHNIWGGQGWEWIEGANGWYCMLLWQHYAFTGDTNYLRTIYPILKETCNFWQQHLKALPAAVNGVPAGTLVVTNGWSPETSVAREDGVTCDQELVWDVFNNYREACSILNTDAVYSVTVSNLQANLLLPRVGPWGQLREWFYHADTPGPSSGANSEMHLCGLYPGRQLIPDVAPALAAAARVRLLSWGDSMGGGEWLHTQNMTFYARLHDWWWAHRSLWFLYGATFPNLWAGTVPQLDGSPDVTAGVGEMLLQSHAGYIDLLPTLPDAWPSGSFSGLCARGGYTVSATWTNAAAAATITAGFAGNCVVHTPNPVTVTSNGMPVTVTSLGGGKVQWPVAAGGAYSLQWVLPPFPAQLPAPMDYAAGINLGTNLSWLSSGTTSQHDVYFSSSSNAVATATTNSPQYLGRTSTTNFSLSQLQPSTTYFWRVDEISGTNVGAGAVWQFTTVSFTATNPNPAVAQTGVITNTALSWAVGVSTGFVSQVYFGISSNAVAGATTNSPEYLGATTTTNFFPGLSLQFNTTYYWRVDDWYGTNLYPGSVWYFTTTPIQGAPLLWDASVSAVNAQDGSGNWGSSATNWLLAGTNTTWLDLNVAVFGVNTTTNCLVTITNTVTPAGITFNATGGGVYTLANDANGAINLSGAMVVTASNNATISALLQGAGSLNLAGNRTVSLTAANTHTGGTIVNGGTLVESGANSGGTGPLTVNAGGKISYQVGGYAQAKFSALNISGGVFSVDGASANQVNCVGKPVLMQGGTLTSINGLAGPANDGGYGNFFLNGGVMTVSGSGQSIINATTFGAANGASFNVGVTGAGVDLLVASVFNNSGNPSTLVKNGPGVMQLAATNTYAGATTINSGTVLVTGSIAANSAVTVQSAGTLAGNGTVFGVVTNNGTLSAGVNSAGTLTTGAETWTAGSTNRLNLTSTNSNGAGLLNISGALTLTATTGNPVVITPVSLAASNTPGYLSKFNKFTGYSWTLATASGGVVNFATNKFVVNTSAFANDFSGGRFAAALSGNSVLLQYSAAPLVYPRFTNLLVFVGGTMQLSGTGGVGQAYVLLGATNLSPANWTPIATNLAGTNGVFQFTDLQVTNQPQRFYRLTSP